MATLSPCYLFATVLLGCLFHGASSIEVVIYKTHQRQPQDEKWAWTTDMPNKKSSAFPSIGWERTDDGRAYKVCDVDVDDEPNNWLYSGSIGFEKSQEVDITITYSINLQCEESKHRTCKEFLDVYVMESNTRVDNAHIPSPLTNYSLYRNISSLNLQTPWVKTTAVIPLLVKTKYIVLAFHDQGACGIIYSVKVSYRFCPEKHLRGILASFPLTVASLNGPLLVAGKCAPNSVQVAQGSLVVSCESSGEWNTSRLEGRCVCVEGKESRNGTCEECPQGTFNDQSGNNCTGVPSAPRNIDATFVNETSVQIRWRPPAITGESTHLFYDVICRKHCSIGNENCLEKDCGSRVSYVPSAVGIYGSQVIVTHLSPDVDYTFKVYARNRVSKLAKERYGVEANVSTITVRTLGTIPGKPDVSVKQVKYNVSVTWKLEHKNGVIKGYHVIYIRDDDPTDRVNLITKEMTQSFDDLKPGRTYEFQVYAVNNYGKGPKGVKKFTVRNSSGGALNKLVVPIAAGGGSLLFILAVVIALYAILVLRRRRRNVQKEYMRSIERGGETDQRGYIDPTNHSDLMQLLSTFSSEIERRKIKLEGVIGQGEFADVYKGILKSQGSEDIVAVKVLRPGSSSKNQRDFLSEASILAQFDHPNVIRLIGVVTESTPMMILTEFLESGSLDNFLKERSGLLTNLQLVGMARGVACGMVYLSELNFIHRDLAARNILVGENMFCKVADFGLSRELAEDDPSLEYETQGGKIAVRWTAPEALQNRIFSSASDVWSYGILLWEIMSFIDRPYWDWNNADVIKRVTTGYRLPAPKDCPKVIHSLMMDCWASDKNDRPKFADIVCRLNEIIRSPDSLKHDPSSQSRNTPGRKDVTGLESVKEWLISINMETYLALFKAANIDSLEKLAKLEEKDLMEMGVKLVGHRNKMNKSIKSKRTQFDNTNQDMKDEARV